MANIASLLREAEQIKKTDLMTVDQKTAALAQIKRQIAEVTGQTNLPLDVPPNGGTKPAKT